MIWCWMVEWREGGTALITNLTDVYKPNLHAVSHPASSGATEKKKNMYPVTKDKQRGFNTTYTLVDDAARTRPLFYLKPGASGMFFNI